MTAVLVLMSGTYHHKRLNDNWKMIMCHPELQFTRPKLNPAMVAKMEQVLLDAPEPWQTAASVGCRLNVGITESAKRIVRELASQSGGRIISGQRGYCHVTRATVEEVEHSSAQLTSQAQEMLIRARDQRNAKGIELYKSSYCYREITAKEIDSIFPEQT